MPGMNLTRDEAAQRAAHLQVNSYEINLDLNPDTARFGSATTVHFRCSQPGWSTFIDLVGAQLNRVVLNGNELDPAQVYDGVRLQLDNLAEQNTLHVHGSCTYMNTGEGLHRFVDPADGQVYLYTQFEVADARRMFAVFDQPDLKATYQFSVTAPSHWQVFSVSPTPTASPVQDHDQHGQPRSRWDFTPTPVLSSYVTAIVAGPYQGATGQYINSTTGVSVPLGVYCRASLRPFLDTEHLLTVTQQGFGFFEQQFQRPYPFEKYDQIFVPEFNAGAMENAGCVTLLEDYVERSKVPDAFIERRAETILHELAHMWFGDLVTMRWWDDLWLNESFATFASVLCQTEATQWTNGWTTFANVEKTWAYRQDQLPSTHPIVADIRDLEDVEVNFDGITYAKGAAVLKQLVAWVGREQFFQGIRHYFDAHQWGNATLADLLHQLERTSGRDLQTWSQLWLQTSGINTIRADFDTDPDGLYTRFAILQDPPQVPADQAPTLRPHQLAAGLYTRQADGRITCTDSIEVSIEGASTELPELVGKAAPDLLLLNDKDLAYTKIRFDQRSLDTLINGISRIEDDLARVLCWSAAWDMTRDAELPARDYLALVSQGIGGEQDSSMLRTLLRQAELSATLYVDPAARPQCSDALAHTFLRELDAAQPGSDAQLQLVRAFAGMAHSDEHQKIVLDLFTGAATRPGLVVDTDLRWGLLHSLISHASLPASAIEDELAHDDTAAGHRYAAAARAAQPNAQAKTQTWQELIHNDDLPNATRNAMIAGFAPVHQHELVRPFISDYFAMIEQVWATRTNDTAQSLVTGLYPHLFVEQATIELTTAWMQQHPEAPASLHRLLRESADGIARALRVQAYDRTHARR